MFFFPSLFPVKLPSFSPSSSQPPNFSLLQSFHIDLQFPCPTAPFLHAPRLPTQPPPSFPPRSSPSSLYPFFPFLPFHYIPPSVFSLIPFSLRLLLLFPITSFSSPPSLSSPPLLPLFLTIQ